MRVPGLLVLFGAAACVSSGCQLALDFDVYTFAEPDGGPPDASIEQPPPSTPPSTDAAAGETPTRPEVEPPPMPMPMPEPRRDAGKIRTDGGGADTAPPEPDVTVPPEPRIGSVEETTYLFGSVGGDPRRADCVDGAMAGLELWYLPSASGYPDRLAFAAPLCTRLDALDDAVLTGIAGPLDLPAWAGADQGFLDTAPGHWPEEIYDIVLCPPGQVVMGFSGSFDAAPESMTTSALRTLELYCATLEQTEEISEVSVVYSSIALPTLAFAVSGANTFYDQCLVEGAVAAGMDVNSGAWLDGFALRCAVARWPFETGHSCQLDVQCASNACNGLGFCAAGP